MGRHVLAGKTLVGPALVGKDLADMAMVGTSMVALGSRGIQGLFIQAADLIPDLAADREMSLICFRSYSPLTMT